MSENSSCNMQLTTLATRIRDNEGCVVLCATLAHKLQSKSTQAATVEAAASPAHTSQAPLSHTPPPPPLVSKQLAAGLMGKWQLVASVFIVVMGYASVGIDLRVCVYVSERGVCVYVGCCCCYCYCVLGVYS